MLKKCLFCFLTLCLSHGACEEKNFSEYLSLLEKYPTTLGPVASFQQQEIEIVTDPSEMEKIQLKTGRLVGIMAQDRYWLWLNDAVLFPSGRSGVYGRLVWKCSLDGYVATAVLMVNDEGRIGLNCNFRHATRSWELEMPRGCRNKSEAIEDTAVREVKEETGMILKELVRLGEIASDSGITNGIVPIFMAKISHAEEAEREDSEAISSVPFFTVSEILKGIDDGYMMIEMDGKYKKVFLRDPFLTYALLQAHIKGYIDLSKK